MLAEELEQTLAVASKPPVVNNQIQFSPFEYRRALHEALQAHGIRVEAYGPLGTGRHLSKVTVRRIASAVGRTPAQVLLRWCVQRRVVVLTTATHRERIEENPAIFDFTLTEQDMAAFHALDRTGHPIDNQSRVKARGVFPHEVATLQEVQCAVRKPRIEIVSVGWWHNSIGPPGDDLTAV